MSKLYKNIIKYRNLYSNYGKKRYNLLGINKKFTKKKQGV